MREADLIMQELTPAVRVLGEVAMSSAGMDALTPPALPEFHYIKKDIASIIAESSPLKGTMLPPGGKAIRLGAGASAVAHAHVVPAGGGGHGGAGAAGSTHHWVPPGVAALSSAAHPQSSHEPSVAHRPPAPATPAPAGARTAPDGSGVDAPAVDGGVSVGGSASVLTSPLGVPPLPALPRLVIEVSEDGGAALAPPLPASSTSAPAPSPYSVAPSESSMAAAIPAAYTMTAAAGGSAASMPSSRGAPAGGGGASPFVPSDLAGGAAGGANEDHFVSQAAPGRRGGAGDAVLSLGNARAARSGAALGGSSRSTLAASALKSLDSAGAAASPRGPPGLTPPSPGNAVTVGGGAAFVSPISAPRAPNAALGGSGAAPLVASSSGRGVATSVRVAVPDSEPFAEQVAVDVSKLSRPTDEVWEPASA
jgi:hypothetical protein